MTTYNGATGAAPTGAMATGALGDAPTPTAPPQSGGRTGKLRYRVLDPVTGAVLIDDLPHLHQSKWDIVGFQVGAVGRSAIGTFEVKLFPPGSDGFKNAKTAYDQLSKGQRIEPYRGDLIAGDPWPQTGFIKTITKSYTDFTLAGDISLGLLQAEKTGRSEVFSGRTDQLVSYALKAYDMTFGDDFSLGLGNFTNDGGWTTVTDPLTGKGAISPGTTGDGLLYTTTSFANSVYADISIEVPFRLSCDATTGATAELSIVAALSDTSNFVLGQMLLRYVDATHYAVDLIIRDKVAGVYTVRSKGGTAVYTVPINNLPGRLELKGYQASVNSYLWRLTLNGTDVGCFWNPTVGSGVPSGKVGVRSTHTGVYANAILYAAGAPDGLTVWSKINWFQAGRISTGTQSVNQAIPDTPMIDLLQLAATTENGEYRVNPKAGLNQDTIDFGLTVGNDLSASVKFDDTNVISASLEPDAEPFGAGVQSAGAPSLGGTGYSRWYDISVLRRLGRRMITNPAARISDVLAHRYFAARITNLAGNVGQAMRIVVKRDEFAERVRELDWVTIHLPALGIVPTRAKVVGYVFREGANEIEYLINQYPRRLDRSPQLDRLMANVDYLMTKADTATDPANPFAVVKQNSTTLPINPWKMQAYIAAAQSIASDGVGTVMHLDTVVFDTANGFDPTNHWYTVQVSGYYAVSVTTTINLTGGVTWFLITPVVYNRTTGLTLDQSVAVNGTYPGGSICLNTNYGQTLSDIQYFNAGDQIQAVCIQQNSAATAQPLAVGRGLCYMTIHLVSG